MRRRLIKKNGTELIGIYFIFQPNQGRAIIFEASSRLNDVNVCMQILREAVTGSPDEIVADRRDISRHLVLTKGAIL